MADVIAEVVVGCSQLVSTRGHVGSIFDATWLVGTPLLCTSFFLQLLVRAACCSCEVHESGCTRKKSAIVRQHWRFPVHLRRTPYPIQ
jgi:hypothetical protein